jgi:hypothetical protein
MLFYWAILVYGLVLNIWGHRFLPFTNTVSGQSFVLDHVSHADLI